MDSMAASPPSPAHTDSTEPVCAYAARSTMLSMGTVEKKSRRNHPLKYRRAIAHARVTRSSWLRSATWTTTAVRKVNRMSTAKQQSTAISSHHSVSKRHARHAKPTRAGTIRIEYRMSNATSRSHRFFHMLCGFMIHRGSFGHLDSLSMSTPSVGGGRKILRSELKNKLFAGARVLMLLLLLLLLPAAADLSAANFPCCRRASVGSVPWSVLGAPSMGADGMTGQPMPTTSGARRLDGLVAWVCTTRARRRPLNSPSRTPRQTN